MCTAPATQQAAAATEPPWPAQYAELVTGAAARMAPQWPRLVAWQAQYAELVTGAAARIGAAVAAATCCVAGAVPRRTSVRRLCALRLPSNTSGR